MSTQTSPSRALKVFPNAAFWHGTTGEPTAQDIANARSRYANDLGTGHGFPTPVPKDEMPEFQDASNRKKTGKFSKDEEALFGVDKLTKKKYWHIMVRNTPIMAWIDMAGTLDFLMRGIPNAQPSAQPFYAKLMHI